MIDSAARHRPTSVAKEPSRIDNTTNAVTISQAYQTLELLQDREIAPVPMAYEVFYNYLSGMDEMLTHQLDRLFETEGTIELERLTRIHEQFFIEPLKMSELHDDLFAGIEDEMSSFLGVVTEYLNSNEDFSGELNRSVSGIHSEFKPHKIRQTIEKIVTENQKMRRETRLMSERLEQSRGEIREIRNSLAEAQEKIMCDPLTGLGNRRKLDHMLAWEIDNAREGKADLCLALADIDHFKRVNDTFGHPVGDAVLRFFGELLLSNIKGRDVATRYGGEEFAIILPQTSSRDAAFLMDKIREELEKAHFTVNKSGEPLGKITVSFGVTSFRPGDHEDDMIERADALLYKAKQNGRNQVASET
ncbi:MAG: GGDEF domain-containing protein [Pseudomonadota bacterium]